jgi:hypothetical protein
MLWSLSRGRTPEKGIEKMKLELSNLHMTRKRPVSQPRTQVPAGVKGFGLTFGLDPRVAALTLMVDSMLFGGEGLTGGLLVAVAPAAGFVLGFITYLAQIHWYGDDRKSATIKSLVVALLTAIPAPLPAICCVLFSGLLGLRHNMRKK